MPALILLFLGFLTSIILGSNNSPNGNTLIEPPAPTPTIEAQQSPNPNISIQATPIPEDSNIALITNVIDGDTIATADGQRIRYIGIDTPETVDPNRPIGCYGKEASNKNKELVLGKEVYLEKDVSETDKYGRLLRYVWVGDKMINKILVEEGFAQASSYPPDVKYQSEFTRLNNQARENKIGLWGETCEVKATPVPTTKPLTIKEPTIAPKPATSTSCFYACNGDDKDCSDFSSQSQAQQFFTCCGFSAANDPMRLDNAGEAGNGKACESLP